MSCEVVRLRGYDGLNHRKYIANIYVSGRRFFFEDTHRFFAGACLSFKVHSYVGVSGSYSATSRLPRSCYDNISVILVSAVVR